MNKKKDEEWEKFIGDIAGKISAKNLDKAGLWNDLNNMVNEPDENSFEQNKKYWITYFKALRKENKIRESKKQENGKK